MVWYDHVASQKKQNAERMYIGWKVWQDNGDVFKSSMHHPDEIPDKGIQMLMKYRRQENGRVVADVWGGIYNPAHFHVPGRTKPPPVGTWLTDEEYHAIRIAAMKDFDF